MKTTVLCLCLLLAVVPDAAEGRPSDVVIRVGEAIKRAGEWLRDRGFKRSVDDMEPDQDPENDMEPEWDPEELEEMCPQFAVGEDAPLSVVVGLALSQSDANGDMQLDQDEYQWFLNLIVLLDYCEEMVESSD